MVASSWPSPVSIYEAYLRRCFSTAGLSSQILDVDDQTTLHFWAPIPMPTQRPSLVLLHGFGPIALFQWRPQVQFLSRDFDLYVPDLVFFGKSTTKATERTEIFQARAVAKLMEKVGVERYSVAGTSYGGFVAYQMGTMWPERVEKVVIASSGVNMTRRDNEGLMRRAKLERIEQLLLPETGNQGRSLIRLALYRWRRALLLLPDLLLNHVLQSLYSENKDKKSELLRGLTLGRADKPNIHPLQQEVLIVWGQHDQIFLLEKAFELKKLLGGKARLEVIENTGHVPQLENPTLFNNIVRNFLCD